MNPFQLQGQVILDAQKVYQSGSQLVVLKNSGTTTSYHYDSPTIAAALLTAINSAQLNATGLFLGSVSPNPFDFHTYQVAITGFGFKINGNYTLFLENLATQDNNGWNMVCTVVDSFNMTAIFNSDGDNAHDNPIGIYLYDGGSTYSNMIIGTTPSGTIIQY